MDLKSIACVLLITVVVNKASAKWNENDNELFILKRQCEAKCTQSCQPVKHRTFKWTCVTGTPREREELKFEPSRREKHWRRTPSDPEDCPDCKPSDKWICPRHKRFWIRDKEVPYPQRNRAFRTIPDGFAIKTSSIPKAGLGVWTTKDIPKCIIIGPYGGEKVFNNDNSTRYYAWAVDDDDDNVRYLIDALEPSKSNWLRYINMPVREKDENLNAVQYNGEMYYQTTKAIPAGSELYVWYGDAYAKHLGLILEEKTIKRT